MGFRDRAPSGGLGVKFPEAQKNIASCRRLKRILCVTHGVKASIYCCCTQICIQNVNLEIFCEFSNQAQ